MKEPWQMTWDEYRSPEVGGVLGRFQAAIRQAVADGKPVAVPNLQFLTIRELKGFGARGRTAYDLAVDLSSRLRDVLLVAVLNDVSIERAQAMLSEGGAS